MRIKKINAKFLIIIFNLFAKTIVIFKKLNLNKFSEKIEKLFQIYLFRYFKSNHLNRIRYVQELYLSKKTLHKIDNKRNFSKIIFIGDSHVEMYSRSNTENFYEFSPMSIWLGPCTVLGTYFTQNHNELISKINEIYDFSKINNAKHLIFSIGSIDVRTLFFQLLVAKSIDNEEDLFLEFEKAIMYFVENVINRIRNDQKASIMKIYNSSIIGDEPEKISEINEIKKKNDFPTFGSLQTRQRWTNKVNNIIEEKCRISNLGFIDVDIGSGEDIIKKHSEDGIHINDMMIINKISNLIYSLK